MNDYTYKTVKKLEADTFIARGWFIDKEFGDYFTLKRKTLPPRLEIGRNMEELFADVDVAKLSKNNHE